MIMVHAAVGHYGVCSCIALWYMQVYCIMVHAAVAHYGTCSCSTLFIMVHSALWVKTHRFLYVCRSGCDWTKIQTLPKVAWQKSISYLNVHLSVTAIVWSVNRVVIIRKWAHFQIKLHILWVMPDFVVRINVNRPWTLDYLGHFSANSSFLLQKNS